MRLTQSSHIWDGGCSLIFSWKGCCNIDKELFVNLQFSPDPPPASVSERLCLCVWFQSILCWVCSSAIFFFSWEIWRAIYSRLLEQRACAVPPPSCSSHLASRIHDAVKSSSHTFLPLIPDHLLFLSSFCVSLCFRHDHLPSASLGISACELLTVAGWQWLGAMLRIAALTEDKRQLSGTETCWYDRQTGFHWLSVCVKLHAFKNESCTENNVFI